MAAGFDPSGRLPDVFTNAGTSSFTQFLSQAAPELLPIARDCMAPSYPELAKDFGRISTYAYAEEEAFLSTLRAGTTILDTALSEAKKSGGRQLSGAQAFQLHDTYGFPIDLTLEMAAEQGLDVDQDGFRRLMKDFDAMQGHIASDDAATAAKLQGIQSKMHADTLAAGAARMDIQNKTFAETFQRQSETMANQRGSFERMNRGFTDSIDS